MKQSLINIRNKARDFAHIVGGFTLFYLLGNNLFNFTETLYLWQALFLTVVAGFIGGCIIGVTYEIIKLLAFKNPVSDWDIYRTGFGAVLGFGMASFVKDIYFITDLLKWLCVCLLAMDIGYAIYNKIKEHAERMQKNKINSKK